MEPTAQSLRVSESRIRLRVQSETPADARNSDMNSEQQRLSKLGVLANVFGAEPTGAVLDMYLQALEDLTDEQFRGDWSRDQKSKVLSEARRIAGTGRGRR